MNQLTFRPDVQQMLPHSEGSHPLPAPAGSMGPRRGSLRSSLRHRTNPLSQPVDDGFRLFRVY